MSVQLIIYPQSYQGIHTSNSTTNTTNLVADGTGFNTIGNHTGYSSSANDPAFDAVTNDAPISNWKKFRSQGSSSYADVDYPIRIGGFVPKLRFRAASGGSNSSSGIYQQINNLVVGTTYQLKFKIVNAAANGFIFIGNGSFGNNLGGGGVTLISTATTGFKTYDFTASNSTEVLILDYQNSGNDYIDVRRISIKGAGANPPTVITDLFDGQVICDLYEDEDIPLSLSIDDFKNVAEKTQSYSKDFNLPATKRNNKIFTQIFEITNSVESNGDSFNPYIQTQCVLKQDGNIIFRGFLKLLDIVNKEGEISYNVNLYTESIVLVDVLKNKKFSDLDFSELEHEYHKTNIVNSWYDSTGITLSNALDTTSFAYDSGLGVNNTKVLKYPFVDWTGDLTVDSSNMPILNKLEDAFRPFINCKYILNKIFDDAGFTYTSTFLDSSTFTNLFMDFNWGAGNAPVDLGSNSEIGLYMNNTHHYAGTSYTNLKLNRNALGFVGWGTSVDYNDSTDIITSVNNNSTYTIDYSYDIVVNAAFPFNQYSTRWLITRNDGSTEEKDLIPLTISTGGTVTYSGNLTITLDLGETAQAQFLASSTNSVYQKFDTIFSPPQINFSTVLVTKSVDAITDSTLLNNLRGDLAQWDFLKSIINMFNLIIRQDESNPTNLLIETYDTVFNQIGSGLTLLDRNITHDWTDKVDASEIKLTPLNLVKETIFDYAEDEEDYPTNFYKNTFSSSYGGKVFTARGNTIFEGSEQIEAIAFSATVVKPLFDYLSQFLTPAIYSKESGTFESFDNLPRILYKTSASPFTMTDGTTYKIPAQNGVAETAAETRFLQFSHTTELPPTSTSLNFNFGTNQLIGISGNTLNSLYQENWSTYFDELYNFDTKSMTVKVNLNAADIAQFDFNDKVMIMNRSYRVNRIDYKPNDLSTVEFILIP
tara:strand:+ start:2368 stop:5160 length:2793 start_codon:yes stop_codon:yes gene_type:complete